MFEYCIVFQLSSTSKNAGVLRIMTKTSYYEKVGVFGDASTRDLRIQKKKNTSWFKTKRQNMLRAEAEAFKLTRTAQTELDLETIAVSVALSALNAA